VLYRARCFELRGDNGTHSSSGAPVLDTVTRRTVVKHSRQGHRAAAAAYTITVRVQSSTPAGDAVDATSRRGAECVFYGRLMRRTARRDSELDTCIRSPTKLLLTHDDRRTGLR